jgi:hypothetical protein
MREARQVNKRRRKSVLDLVTISIDIDFFVAMTLVLNTLRGPWR